MRLLVCVHVLCPLVEGFKHSSISNSACGINKTALRHFSESSPLWSHPPLVLTQQQIPTHTYVHTHTNITSHKKHHFINLIILHKYHYFTQMSHYWEFFSPGCDLQVYIFVCLFLLDWFLPPEATDGGGGGRARSSSCCRSESESVMWGSNLKKPSGRVQGRRSVQKKQCFHYSSVIHVGMTYLFYTHHVLMRHKLMGAAEEWGGGTSLSSLYKMCFTRDAVCGIKTS